MSVVDRIMRAYASKHDLSPSQAAFVRTEITKIIDELIVEGRTVDHREIAEAADHPAKI